jgi:hypothetical protein
MGFSGLAVGTVEEWNIGSCAAGLIERRLARVVSFGATYYSRLAMVLSRTGPSRKIRIVDWMHGSGRPFFRRIMGFMGLESFMAYAVARKTRFSEWGEECGLA